MNVSPTMVKALVFLLPGIIFMIYYNTLMERNRFQPHIYTLGGGKVLVAEIKGDPDITMDAAETTLFNAARKLKLSPCYMSGRHRKWEQRDTMSRQEWVVLYSRMVPETATGLAGIQDTPTVRLYYERREKTEIAEIMHRGRYEEIPDSLEKLRRYAEKKGYGLGGFYEEVYLVFEHIEPDPGKYETLLRYQVSRLNP